MKQYPSIPGSKDAQPKDCVAFYKYDGSNLRFEYTKKRGFYKFGTRNRLFDKNDVVFGKAIELFNNTYSENLCKIFKDDSRFNKIDQITVFAEFFGEKSFAGQHILHDQTHEVMMFDVWLYKYGLLGPNDFIKYFGHLKTPKIIYQGILSDDFVNKVKDNHFNLNEGVVCKGGTGARDLWMVKIKTKHYLDKLKEVYKDNWASFWE